MTRSLYLILYLRNEVILWESLLAFAFGVFNEGHAMFLSVFLGGGYPVFHWFIGCLFSYCNILESRIGTHIIGQMAIVVFFHRQNAKPSIKTCGISVTGLEGNLREISEVLFETWGTKWLWRALEVKSSCAHCYKASPALAFLWILLWNALSLVFLNSSLWGKNRYCWIWVKKFWMWSTFSNTLANFVLLTCIFLHM